jgi:hypothetical protein
MYALVFSVLWTVVSAFLIVTNIEDLDGWERGVALLFPLFGLFAIHASWLHWRRRRSLRIEQRDGMALYVWIELDGRECRSTKDPRDDWDGGDGDGDGGD